MTHAEFETFAAVAGGVLSRLLMEDKPNILADLKRADGEAAARGKSSRFPLSFGISLSETKVAYRLGWSTKHRRTHEAEIENPDQGQLPLSNAPEAPPDAKAKPSRKRRGKEAQ